MRDRAFLQWLLVGFIACAIMASAARGQDVAFDVDAMSVRAEEGSSLTRLDLYTKVPYTRLNFLSADDGFEARYEVTAQVFTTDQSERPAQLVQSRSWTQTVTVPGFEATQSGERYDPSSQSLEVSPGRYLVEFQVRDESSGETFMREVPVQVRNLRGNVAVSDLLLLDEHDAESNTIFPAITGRIGTDRRTISFFYETYTPAQQTVHVRHEVKRINQRSRLSSVRRLLGWGDDDQQGETVFANRKSDRLPSGRHQDVAAIPMDSLRAGNYVLHLVLEDQTGQELASASEPFVVEWSGLDRHVRELDAAIAQLQYIAKEKEINHIRSAGSRREQLQRFQAFWEKRDPTPGTRRNERMEEYYYRVSIANQNFGSMADGWRTARGHVHVLFGEPDYIERHPYSEDAEAYQIWYYHRIGRRFIFVDKSGEDNYELVVPIWDERTRIR